MNAIRNLARVSAAWATPVVHDTRAGLRINPACQVIDMYGDVIPGLYCGGESAGGFSQHGLARAARQGFIAGRAAAAAPLGKIGHRSRGFRIGYVYPAGGSNLQNSAYLPPAYLAKVNWPHRFYSIISHLAGGCSRTSNLRPAY